jgi:ATP-dependent protease HslVU (ClpYQ) peptidase subunit
LSLLDKGIRMTTIIMKEENGGVSIAYDSQVTRSLSKNNTRLQKVFRNGSLIIGMAGNLSVLNAVKFETFEEVGDNPEKWAVTHFAPKLREVADRLHVCKSVCDDCVNYQTLVVAGGKVFNVDCFLGVDCNIGGLYAIGSGSEFALGALAMGASVRSALGVAAQFDIGTGGALHATTAARLLGN